MPNESTNRLSQEDQYLNSKLKLKMETGILMLLGADGKEITRTPGTPGGRVVAYTPTTYPAGQRLEVIGELELDAVPYSLAVPVDADLDLLSRHPVGNDVLTREINATNAAVDAMDGRLTTAEDDIDALENGKFDKPAGEVEVGSFIGVGTDSAGDPVTEWKDFDTEISALEYTKRAVQKITFNGSEHAGSDVDLGDTVTKITVNGMAHLGREVDLGTLATLQMVYDTIHPVGDTVFGFRPTVPTGVTATWTLDTSAAGRFIRIGSSESEIGTVVEEELPIPILNEVDGHKHSFTPAGAISSDGQHEHSGIFWGTSPILPKGSNVWGYNYSAEWASNGYSNALVTGKAGSHSHTFTGSSGNTSENGAHTPTVKADDVYKSGAKVQPKGITIGAWKRTA